MAKIEKFIYDVFISYSVKDRPWIKKNLLPKLKQKGIKYCVDFRDFAAGKAAMGNMRDAVKNSRHTILVMTPNWVKSEWTFFEALLSRGKDPAGLRQRTIPLKVKKCEVDDILSLLTWVDLTQRGSKATAWNQLYTALGKRPAPKQPRQVRKKRKANWHLAHPYAMPPNFTGRVAERNMLSQWLNEDVHHPLLILRALGGFGKSALSWYWLIHDVDSTKWQKAVWWSFYEGDASFENFISATLDYLKIEKPEGQRNQVDKLLDVMKRENLLLVMDGFERALRAYSSLNAAYQGDETTKDEGTERDCVNINAELFLKNLSSLPEIKSKVLMTTRLTPHAVEKHGHKLEGCLEIELMAMDKDDAVKFFRSEGIRGTHAEIEETCVSYGFHPLSLRLLAGLIISDLQTPGDITVAKRLDVSNDIVQNKHHVLEQAYNTMPKERQKLLSQIACFRSLVTYDALKSIATVDIGSETAKKSKTKKKSLSSKNKSPKHKKVILYPDLDNDLGDLLIRGLLHHDTKTNKYDLHPIVRRYAYDRLTAPQRTGAHVVLVVYFEAVPLPPKIEKLEDLTPVIELYHHMVRAGNLDEARNLFRDRLQNAIYYQFGEYQLQIELLCALFLDGEDAPPRLKDESAQAWTLNELSNAYALSGQSRRAIELFKQHNKLRKQNNDEKNLAIGLENIAYLQTFLGKLEIAELNVRRSIKLCRKIKSESLEAAGLGYLGKLLTYRGEFEEATQQFELSCQYWKRIDDKRNLGITVCWNGLQTLFMGDVHAALKAGKYARTLADDKKYESDIIEIELLLGSTRLMEGKDYNAAHQHLTDALMRCRAINNVEQEANILLALARLRYDQKNYEEAKSLADEALLITERCGYVLQGADVNLFLAQYALEQEQDKAKAKAYAEEAKKLATCDGPPYYYKVAYEEAERFLEKLK